MELTRAQQKLVESFLPIAKQEVSKYVARFPHLRNRRDDLLSEAYISLCVSTPKLDMTKPYYQYLRVSIRRAMTEWVTGNPPPEEALDVSYDSQDEEAAIIARDSISSLTDEELDLVEKLDAGYKKTQIGSMSGTGSVESKKRAARRDVDSKLEIIRAKIK